MSYKAVIIFTILAFAGLAQATVTKKEVTNILEFPHFETNEVFTCGGVITDPSEQILYKPFNSVDANERCVWIVAVPKASSYNVRVLYGHNLNSTLNVVGISLFTDVLYSPTLLSSTVNNFATPILVITFHSGSNRTTNGFALEYEVTTTTGTVSSNSSHTIVGADDIFLKFPEGRSTYDNLEISTFILPPLNNRHVIGSNRQVIYKRLELESCHDRLSIYTFSRKARRYILRGNICDGVDTELINHDDIGLMVFRSDTFVTNSGFNLAFTNCGGN